MALIKNFKTPGNSLLPGVYIFLALSIIPIAGIIPGLFSSSETWIHLLENKITHYSMNSMVMVAGTIAVTMLIAIPAAYALARFNFKLKPLLEILLMAPLALPPYILVFGYAGLVDSNPFLFQLLYSNHGGAMYILSVSFFPYLYVPLRWSFYNSLSEHQDLIRLYNLSEVRILFKILLPLSKFALFGGISIVAMEALSEYGALHYLGIDTLTTGIFRTWFHYYDLDVSRKLAMLLLIPTALFLFIENRIKRKNSVNTVHNAYVGPNSKMAALIGTIPVMASIVLPAGGLISMSLFSTQPLHVAALLNTFLLAIPGLLICLTVAVLLHVASLYKRNPLYLSIPTLIHGIPSAVLVLGFLALTSVTDEFFPTTGTIGLLLIIYTVKYTAVPLRSLQSYFSGRGILMHELGRGMGKNAGTIITKIHLPLILKPLLATAVLVFADMIKELPLAMMLRPFDFNTLAIETYQLASNEQLYDAAVPALILMGLGIAAGTLFHTLKENKHA